MIEDRRAATKQVSRNQYEDPKFSEKYYYLLRSEFAKRSINSGEESHEENLDDLQLSKVQTNRTALIMTLVKKREENSGDNHCLFTWYDSLPA